MTTIAAVDWQILSPDRRTALGLDVKPWKASNCEGRKFKHPPIFARRLDGTEVECPTIAAAAEALGISQVIVSKVHCGGRSPVVRFDTRADGALVFTRLLANVRPSRPVSVIIYGIEVARYETVRDFVATCGRSVNYIADLKRHADTSKVFARLEGEHYYVYTRSLDDLMPGPSAIRKEA